MAHVIMEAEIYHSLLSASWRTRRAGGAIQSQSKGPRTRRFIVQGQEEIAIPAHKEREFVLPLPSCCIWALCKLNNAHPHL